MRFEKVLGTLVLCVMFLAGMSAARWLLPPSQAAVTITGPGAASGITPMTTVLGAVATYGSISVATSATTVLAANAATSALNLCNEGTVTIYIGTGATASSVVAGSAGTANAGFPLRAGACKSYDRYSGAIQAISGTAGQDLRYERFTTQ